jgi:hypothetical protein
MDILDKLERKRAFARARARKFYESNKEKVLSNQKSARERLAAEIEAAKVQRNIPLIRQPPPPPQRNEPEPVPRTFRIIRNNENEIVIALTLDRIKEKVKKLKEKTTEFISVNIQDAKTLLRILNVEELNTALKTPENVIQAIEDEKKLLVKIKRNHILLIPKKD